MKFWAFWATAAAIMIGWSVAACAQNGLARQRAAWNQPMAPFTIVGNVHYVGTAQIASYLITGPRGHVLIDAAMEESAGQIADNIERLGFSLSDIRYILVNHAHWDHAGGLAELKRRSGARLVASRADATDLAAGFNAHRSEIPHFPPVAVNRRIDHGSKVRVAGIELTAHLTPGHTPGCTSWTMRTREGQREFDLLFACSLTVAGQKLKGDAVAHQAVTDFETSFARLRRLHADIFLGFHAVHFGLEEKRRRQTDGDRLAFVDPTELSAQIDRAEAAYRNEANRQRADPLRP